jgi:hypothetical protein
MWSRPQATWNSGGVHPFIGGSSGLRIWEVPHVKKDSTPITAFLIFFMKVIQLSVADTNKYYNQYLDTLDTTSRHDCIRYAPLLAIIIQIEHYVNHTLKSYWLTAEQFLTPFYTNIMKCDKFLHILSVIHFSDYKLTRPE